jgi:hypothetical protein
LNSCSKQVFFLKDVTKIISLFCGENIKRINLLYAQVLDERFKKDPTLTIEKNIDIYKLDKCKSKS